MENRMSEYESSMLCELKKISGLLELLAEDKIDQRDRKQRTALLGIVGGRVAMQKSVFLMNGSRTQKEIRTETGAHQGDLSTMVGKLCKAKLLLGDTKMPHLAISIPSNFFDCNAETE
jgi:hypothetical protein